MIQKLNLPVTVISRFDHKLRSVAPVEVLFEGVIHTITKIGYHHTTRDGRVLYHIFSVASATMYFKLVHNTETLFWNLEEIDDGETN